MRVCDFCKLPVQSEKRTCCDRCLMHIGWMLWADKNEKYETRPVR